MCSVQSVVSTGYCAVCGVLFAVYCVCWGCGSVCGGSVQCAMF